MLRNGERPFEVHFGGEVREQLYGENAFRDVNRYIDPRLYIARTMRNENLYLVVYRPRRNEQYSLNVEGLPKAYFEAWVGLRTFRITLSVGLAPSLGDHFKSYYGTLVTELVRVGLKLEGEIVAEVHEAAEKNENKRQLKTGLSIALCKKNKEKRPVGQDEMLQAPVDTGSESLADLGIPNDLKRTDSPAERLTIIMPRLGKESFKIQSRPRKEPIDCSNNPNEKSEILSDAAFVSVIVVVSAIIIIS